MFWQCFYFYLWKLTQLSSALCPSSFGNEVLQLSIYPQHSNRQGHHTWWGVAIHSRSVHSATTTWYERENEHPPLDRASAIMVLKLQALYRLVYTCRYMYILSTPGTYLPAPLDDWYMCLICFLVLEQHWAQTGSDKWRIENRRCWNETYLLLHAIMVISDRW